MIIVRLFGGLCNQLFQYSLGRHLAFIFNTSFALDLSEFSDKRSKDNFILRDYGLEVYNIKAQIATKNELAAFMPGQTLFDRTIKKIRKDVGLIKVKYETELRFQPSVLTMGPNAFLSGYWQSEKYFLPISSIIRSDFTLKTSILNEIDQTTVLSGYKESILNSNSVSVHFRRGDYVNDSATSLTHGTCPEDYYTRAIAQINKKISNPYFFLFSDDTEWIEKNFRQDIRSTIVKTGAGYIDLHLMSLCRHNIIANSSFSWWGAWLNNNPGKIVIAPQKWFANDNLNNQTVDLIPVEWIRL